jgi:pyruvate dehydrogenase E1 component alpha subunit
VVGMAHALDPTTDWIFPYYREQVALRRFGAGILAREVLRLRGHPDGAPLGPGQHVFPAQISLGTQLLHAVGYAWGLKLQDEPGIVATVFGDGSSSEGDAAEAFNLAGVLHVPVLFVCVDNGWAISTPRSRQSAAVSIAARAEGFGLEGVIVDGNDVLAVHQAVTEARHRAATGGASTILELITYRMGPHTTSDDPTRYVPAEDRARWVERDPIDRHRRHLASVNAWSDADEEQARAEAMSRIDAAVDAAEAAPLRPEAMFEHVYANEPERLVRQRREFLAEQEARR